jgi:hypothetical protein
MNRKLRSLFLALTLAFLASSQAGSWNDGTRTINRRGEDFIFQPRPFSAGWEVFYAGPAWLGNVLPGSRGGARVPSFSFDRSGDRVITETGYVGTLRDVFDIGLFNNISFFVGAGVLESVQSPRIGFRFARPVLEHQWGFGDVDLG